MTKSDWLRSEIEKLEGSDKKKSKIGFEQAGTKMQQIKQRVFAQGYNKAKDDIITRYKEELKVLESKKICEICHGFGNNGADDAQCLNCGGSGEELLELEKGV